MLPGPDIVLACPCCDKTVSRSTLASGNTFGASLWSDGKRDAPMLPEPIRVTRCPVCSEIFWVDDATELGEVDWYRKGSGAQASPWKDAPRIAWLDIDGWVSAIDATPSDRLDRVQWLRIELWHALNDPLRDAAENTPSAAPGQRALFLRNLEMLLPLLDESDSQDRFMKAEALREMGRFEEAMRLLMGIGPELEPFARQIRTLAMRQDARVAKLRFDEMRLIH